MIKIIVCLSEIGNRTKVIGTIWVTQYYVQLVLSLVFVLLRLRDVRFLVNRGYLLRVGFEATLIQSSRGLILICTVTIYAESIIF